MEISSLSLGVKIMSLNRRRNFKPREKVPKVAIPTNDFFLPRKTAFQIAERLKQHRQYTGSIPQRVEKIPVLMPRPERTSDPKNAVLMYGGLEISIEPSGLLVDYIRKGRLKIDIPSFVRQFKRKMLNPLHDKEHVNEFIDAISMPNLDVYIKRYPNGKPKLHDDMLVLTLEGDIILHECCLIYLGYVLHQLEKENLTSYTVDVDEKPLLEVFNATRW